jgi:hypothetical protein
MNIEGNRIGTNAAGTAAIANARYGIFTANAMSIGNSTAGAGNTISGNGNDGIFISSNLTTSVIIWGNRIGTNQTGTAILPNGDNGITILADEVTVGGSSAGVKNIIGGNTGHGILIQNSSEIYGNYIGTNASGADLGNGGDGVRLSTFVETSKSARPPPAKATRLLLTTATASISSPDSARAFPTKSAFAAIRFIQIPVSALI